MILVRFSSSHGLDVGHRADNTSVGCSTWPMICMLVVTRGGDLVCNVVHTGCTHCSEVHRDYRKTSAIANIMRRDQNNIPKTTLLPDDRAMFWRASSWRICIAAGDARIYWITSQRCLPQLRVLTSAACLINLAASTSALAAITLDSPILFWVAALERDCCNSTEKLMSLRRIDSMATPHFSAVASIWIRNEHLNEVTGGEYLRSRQLHEQDPPGRRLHFEGPKTGRQRRLIGKWNNRIYKNLLFHRLPDEG